MFETIKSIFSEEEGRNRKCMHPFKVGVVVLVLIWLIGSYVPDEKIKGALTLFVAGGVGLWYYFFMYKGRYCNPSLGFE